MLSSISKFIVGAFVGIASLFHPVQNTPVLGAATVFNSNQVGTSPASGTFLETNGATSTWLSIPTSTSGIANNATGTLDSGAMFNTTNTLTSNGILYVPSNYATAGCAGSSTAKTFQGCVYALYASLAPFGGGTIFVTQDVTSTWTGLLSFNINGDEVSFNCGANTILQYTGTGNDNADTWLPSNSNIALNFDFGNPIGHARTSDSGGCDMRGHTNPIAAGQANSATSTGIYYGGTYSFLAGGGTTSNAGAVGVNIDYNINGFGRNIWVGANAYVDNFTGSSSGGNGGGMLGNLLFLDIANNSGERNVFTSGTYTDPGNSTSTAAIYISNSATASNFFEFNSVDDAQIRVGASDGQVDISDNHFENSDVADYHQYVIIQGVTSDQSTLISFNDNEIANDGSGSNSFQTIIQHGGQLIAIGDHIDNYGGGTVATFSDHSLDDGVESELICQLQVQAHGGGTLTNIVGGGGPQPYSLAAGSTCTQDAANSYPVSMFNNQNNVADIRNGNQNVATFDQNGNWTFPVSGSVLTAQSLSSNQPTSPSSIYTLLTGNVIFGALGTPTIWNGSTTLSANQFCALLNFGIMNNPSLSTSTLNLPTLAAIQSSTPQTGGCGPLVPGAKEIQEVYNSSTVNMLLNASSGIIFKNATTTAWPLGYSSSSVIIPPQGLLEVDGTDVNVSTFFIQNTLYQ